MGGANLSLVSSTRAGPMDVTEDVCVRAEFHLTWTPSPSQGGYNESVCFVATSADTGLCPDVSRGSREHCMRLVVRRCWYALQKDQQLQEIASMFKVDWMRIWSLNANLTHPDYLVYGGQTLMIGHLYSTLSNEFP